MFMWNLNVAYWFSLWQMLLFNLSLFDTNDALLEKNKHMYYITTVIMLTVITDDIDSAFD